MVVIPMLAVALVTVHFNTLVHPFSLADNRHYTFYVFRLLFRKPSIKYLVTPLYILFGWACINALGGTAKPAEIASQGVGINDPSKPDEDTERAEETDDDGVRVSAVVLWLLASTMTLASTPLVEPRYFILPWMMWRLMVPTEGVSGLGTRHGSDEDDVRVGRAAKEGWLDSVVPEPSQSWALYLETIWFTVVNATTGYMFLHRGFAWPSEPGKVQRFMW